MTAHPAHWATDVVLADGGTVHLRPIRPDDAAKLIEMHGRLSAETTRFRYFSPHPTLSEAEVERFTNVDHHQRVALVAELGDRLLAVGRFDGVPGSDIAEVAFVVDDAHQGRGLGSVLLEHLTAVATERGFRRFEAEVLTENVRMRRVFRDAGYEPTSSYDQDVTQLVFSIEATAASLAVKQSREHRSEARSIARLLAPRSVAVVGAGRDESSVGHVVLANLLRGGFRGPVYPINPNTEQVASVRAYPTIDSVPDDIDLAVVAVPASAVAEVVAQCARKRVRGMVIMTGGYSDSGSTGAAAERALVASARVNGMRVIGPNCLGIMSTSPEVRLNASLAPTMPPRGRAGFFCQSGALGTAILSSVTSRGLGLSSFVSAGNRADVSGNDLLQYWEDDPDTDVVLLYLESFGNARKFARLARRVGRTKPIVAVKSGASVVAQLQDGDLTERAVDGLFRQAGVIRVRTLSELFDVSALLTCQPLPRGRRVAVVGNSSPLGRLAADACAAHELTVGPLSESTMRSLSASLVPDVSGTNPLVLPAGSNLDALCDTVRAVLADPGVDAVVTVFVPTTPMTESKFAAVVASATEHSGKPVVSTFLAFDATRAGETVAVGSVPIYPSAEEAVSALARTAAYADWTRRPEGVMPNLVGIAPAEARSVVERALAGQTPAVQTQAGAAQEGSRQSVRLPPELVGEVLSAYGLHVWPRLIVTSLAEAVAAGLELGYPVALKATAAHLRHRPDLGSVRLDIASEAALRDSYAAMTRQLGGGAAQLAVQAMAPPGVATVITTLEDPSFGALVSFGVGGVATDLLGDRAFRVVPLTDLDAAELVRSVRAAPLLFGYRGSEPVDLLALEETVLRVARLVDELPEVAELELNPVIASAAGVSVLRASMRLASPLGRLDAGPRRLR